MEYSNILFNEPPLVVSPQLAKIMGLNEAIILQQLHYWLQKKQNIRDDRYWVYNSIAEWQQQFPFWSDDTIRRTINRLIADGIVIKADFNKESFDKTIWYAIDYDSLDDKIKRSVAKSNYANCINGFTQNARTEAGKLPEPIPKTNQRLPTKTTEKRKSAPKATNFDVLISSHTANSVLADALRDFIKMRSSIKKPLTDRALKMILSKLTTLAKSDDHQIKMLEQSIVFCWQDIYPLKDNQAPQFRNGGQQSGLNKYGAPNYDED